MAIDRDEWLGFQTRLDRLCPRCQRGTLTPIKDAAKSEETADSRQLPEEVEWDAHEWRFTTLLKCSFSACQESAVVAGEKHVEELQVDWDEYQHVDRYRIRFYRPSPRPFPIRPKYPERVIHHVEAASEVYWADAEAAGNKIRQAVEAFLTGRGVKQFAQAEGPRSRSRLSLHARILLYEKQNPDLAKLLFAVKWLGNAGSHDGGLKHADVLDGFELLEHVLQETYANDRKRLFRRAGAINRRKGPLAK